MATKRISQLTQTATEADLKSGNYFALDGAEVTKRLPAEVVAKAVDVDNIENKIVADDFAAVVVGNLGIDGKIDTSNTQRIASSRKFYITSAPTIALYVVHNNSQIAFTNIIRYFKNDGSYIGTAYTQEAAYCMVCAYTWNTAYNIQNVKLVVNGNVYQNKNEFVDLNKKVICSTSSFSSLGCRKYGLANYDYNIVVCYGQSLSRGMSKINGGATEGIDGGLMLGSAQVADTLNFNDKNLTRLRMFNTPVNAGENTPSITAVNSLVYRERIVERNIGVNYVDIAAGASGNTIAQLMDSRRYVDVSTGAFYFPNLELRNTTERPYLKLLAALQRVKNIASSEGKTCGVVAFMFIHGEGDGGTSETPATSGDYSCNGNATEYKARVSQMFNDFKSDARIIFEAEQSPAFFIAEPGGDFLFNLNINKALDSFVDNKEFFLLPPSYQVPNQEDGHPTGNGYRWFGEQIGKSLQSVFVENKVPENLTLLGAKFNGSNEITLSFNIPQKPLFVDTWTLAEMKNYGFSVVADGTERVILDVRCDGEKIVIVTEDLSRFSSVSVEYASEKSLGKTQSNIKGAGNICDSSNQQSYFKNVENLGTSGSVEYEPKDENGNYLVGNPYPLNNFLHAFNLKIK